MLELKRRATVEQTLTLFGPLFVDGAKINKINGNVASKISLSVYPFIVLFKTLSTTYYKTEERLLLYSIYVFLLSSMCSH